jgi:ribosome recycling factor
MIEEILKNTEEKMKKSLKTLTSELSQIRTGRASPALVEKIPVECYNTTMSLQ